MISQQCYFLGGPFDKKMATIAFPEFKQGLTIDVNGHLHIVRDGPIAQCVEETQESVEFGAVVLVYEAEKVIHETLKI